MQLDREYFLRMMKGRSTGAVVVEGSEGGGGGVTLGPLLASLNAVAMPTAEGYLHWTGSAWEFPPIDLSSYATQQWVLQQGYITSSAISDMATETWVLQQGYITSSAISDMATETWVLQQGYLTSYDMSNYALKSWVNSNFVGKDATTGRLTDSLVFADFDYGIDFYDGNTYGGRLGLSQVDSSYSLTFGDGQNAKRVLLAGDADKNIPLHDRNGNWSGGKTSMNGLRGYFRYVNAGVYELDYLPKSGGTLSSTLEIATGGDRKLVLNNTDNELWNVISFQDNGTEVGYLGLCGSNALAWNQHAILLAGYDNDFITHGNEFTFASAGFGSDVSQFPNGRMVWFNYRTASGNLDGNISSYKFGDGKGGELAEISNGQFSGNAASATKALKVVQGNNDRLVTNANGVTAVGDNNNSTIGFRTDGSAHYEPYIMTRKTLDGSNSAEFHLDYYTANGGHHFKDATSGYADVYAKSFVANGSSNDYVLLGGGGTKEVIDFATWMDRPVTARGLNVAGDSTMAAPHVRMTYDYVSAGRFSMNFMGYAGDSLVAPISYIFDAPVTQSSDIRMKDIIRDEAFDAESIAKMPLVTFAWKKDEEKRGHFGTIAQNWEKVIPEVVIEGGDGMKAMDYGAAAMAAGVTACRKAVELERRIAELEEIINQLKQ